jgi:DMSO/TMAO reductase YedYZ molybdopterin-dependent catalytic subunit
MKQETNPTLMTALSLLALVLIGLPVIASCSRTSSDYMPGEAHEFQGVQLTPMNLQQTNALKGPQYLDELTYRLTVDGLVEHPLSIDYGSLISYPMVSRVIVFHCVDGWEFTAKWTGPLLTTVLDQARLKAEVNTVIFHTADYDRGFSSLRLSYVKEYNVILAVKINDITLPPERGFPFQVTADGKFGYKWAKWVDRIELSSDSSFRGAWEAAGYNNNADINGPALDPNR